MHMELFWYMLGVAISGSLFAVGLILGWYWLTGVGLIIVPAIAIWGITSSGPGSPHNPYPEH
jgi:hypothetical protein